MNRPRRIRIPLPFFCPLGLAIVSACHLALATGDTALVMKHHEPLYLIHVTADVVELVLFGWKAYRLSLAESKQSRKRKHRATVKMARGKLTPGITTAEQGQATLQMAVGA